MLLSPQAVGISCEKVGKGIGLEMTLSITLGSLEESREDQDLILSAITICSTDLFLYTFSWEWVEESTVDWF